MGEVDELSAGSDAISGHGEADFDDED
jgi:hypothetical protein